MKIFICEDDPKQRENMVTIIKNYIMIEEKPMEIALATDNPYEVLEQAKNMNDIGCYFLDIQLSTDINGIKLGSEIVSMTQLVTLFSLRVTVNLRI